MGGGHSHVSGHVGGQHRWRLTVSFVLVATFFVVELAAGLLADSLALISDAAHMGADVVALGAALVATRIATRPDKSGRRTFGSYRAEVFATGLTVLLMLGAAAYVALAAISRAGTVTHVDSGPMLVVGALGLAVNVVAMVLLRSGSKVSLNVRAAYLEVVADALGSIGVIVAGFLVAQTGDAWWDTVVALGIAAFVAVRAVMLGREVLTVLGQHAPAGMVPAEMETALAAVPGVTDVHDLHVWTLTSGMHVATVHLLVDEGTTQPVLAQAREMLRRDYAVDHATLQVETDASECDRTSW